MVRDFDLELDRALDTLGAEPPVRRSPRDDGLDELLEVASRLRTLPAKDWPDPNFADRLVGGVSQAVRSRRRARARQRWTWASVSMGLSAAAAIALILALAPFSPVGPTPAVSAQTLARRAAAVTSGQGLGPVRFTEVVTSHPSALAWPAPPPSKVTETVTYGSSSRWRVDATVVEANGAGVAHLTTIRHGEQIAAESLSPAGIRSAWTVTTHAGNHPGLPAAGTYGMVLDPQSILSAGAGPGAGKCARSLTLSDRATSVDGRSARVLELGADPCPSAAVPDSAGPATFIIDARTSLVLGVQMYSTSGTLLEQAEVTQLDFGGTFAPSLFALPAPSHGLPTPPPTPPAKPELVDLAQLQARLGHRPLVPSRLPAELHQGQIAPAATDPATGKLTAFTITYDDGAGHPAVQLYEAPAASQSVRFPGRAVPIRSGLTATLDAAPTMTILWWIQDSTYLSLQQGGQSAGVTLSGHLTQQQLIDLAAATS